jgi:hypothetical protein
MPRNNKGLRFAQSRWALERAFVEKFPKFEVCSRLLFLFITVSDKLSRKNILFCEKYLSLFRDNPEFPKDPLFEQRVLQLSDAIRRAKDRLVNREAKRETKKEKEERKAQRKTKNEAAPLPVSDVDQDALWASMLPKENNHDTPRT